MKSYYKTLFLIFFIFIALAVAGGSKAHAAATCTLAATPINFPPYDSSVIVTATGTVTVTCTTPPPNTKYTVSLGPSSGGNPVNARALIRTAAPFDQMAYTITTPATSFTAAGLLWGDGTLGTSVVTERFNVLTTLTMTGAIPAGQNMTQGSYQDNITATVTP